MRTGTTPPPRRGWRSFAAGACCGGGLMAVAVSGAQTAWRDPLEVAPAHYTVRLENDRVRVIEGVDQPGESIPMHDHPDTLMVALSSFERRLTLADGRVIDTASQAGDVRWMPAQGHAGENTGRSATRALFVELKACPLQAGR